jgi:hypothetical protein
MVLSQPFDFPSNARMVGDEKLNSHPPPSLHPLIIVILSITHPPRRREVRLGEGEEPLAPSLAS